MGEGKYFYLEKIFGRAVDFFKGLLAGVRHGLHGGQDGGGGYGDCCPLFRSLRRHTQGEGTLEIGRQLLAEFLGAVYPYNG